MDIYFDYIILLLVNHPVSGTAISVPATDPQRYPAFDDRILHFEDGCPVFERMHPGDWRKTEAFRGKGRPALQPANVLENRSGSPIAVQRDRPSL
ncbi:hypothetical protein J8I29_29550 [Labrys sp. LIt4]|uniref:hypothetical protein n=1 Tax=Labrys sp. LIt4 TaxID=2821355 RepID=UPI001ADEE805|nr:hypothetical protein [Labrys sp. LIt4]MBP0583495.1 hypothetical protein [Labrys sp. LIt4]